MGEGLLPAKRGLQLPFANIIAAWHMEKERTQLDPSLTRAEYWLLEAAVEAVLPIAGLMNGDAADQAYKTDHHVGRDELVDALERLFQTGLIVGELLEDFSPPPKPQNMILSRWQIEEELNRPRIQTAWVDGYDPLAVYYRLTPKGGSVWEAFARPNWELFLGGFCGELSGRRLSYGYAASPNKDRIRSYLEGVHWFGWDVDIQSARWRTIRSWPATYWKVLPTVEYVRFRITSVAPEINWGKIPGSYLELNEWYRWRS
jgi:hypothetical protein